MNKTQLRQAINKDVYEYMNERYPEFEIDDSEGYGRIYFIDTTSSNPADDSIEYHQSRHEVCVLNWANDKVKDVAAELENWVNALIKQYQ